jgi:Fur family ferric uptake transcriptional regulator
MSAAADLLRSAGARVTSWRVRVLDALMAEVRPLSHAELEARLPDVDRVTLYRVLDALVELGLAVKATDMRGVFRYTATTSRRAHAEHVHFHCTGCGGVYCLDAAPPASPELPPGFRLDEVVHELRGACPKCAQGRA